MSKLVAVNVKYFNTLLTIDLEQFSGLKVSKNYLDNSVSLIGYMSANTVPVYLIDRSIGADDEKFTEAVTVMKKIYKSIVGFWLDSKTPFTVVTDKTIENVDVDLD